MSNLTDVWPDLDPSCLTLIVFLKEFRKKKKKKKKKKNSNKKQFSFEKKKKKISRQYFFVEKVTNMHSIIVTVMYVKLLV